MPDGTTDDIRAPVAPEQGAARGRRAAASAREFPPLSVVTVDNPPPRRFPPEGRGIVLFLVTGQSHSGSSNGHRRVPPFGDLPPLSPSRAGISPGPHAVIATAIPPRASRPAEISQKGRPKPPLSQAYIPGLTRSPGPARGPLDSVRSQRPGIRRPAVVSSGNALSPPSPISKAHRQAMTAVTWFCNRPACLHRRCAEATSGDGAVRDGRRQMAAPWHIKRAMLFGVGSAASCGKRSRPDVSSAGGRSDDLNALSALAWRHKALLAALEFEFILSIPPSALFASCLSPPTESEMQPGDQAAPGS